MIRTFVSSIASDFGGVDAADVGYDLVLLLGQSNMAGYSTGADTTRYDVTDPRVLQYGSAGTYGGVISQAVEPLAMHDAGTNTGIGPGLHFARWYLHSVPANRRVLLVPAAHGGTPLSSTASPLGWRRGVSGNLYALALAQTAAALTAAGANARIVAALWVQGETDGDNSVTGATYRTDLDALIGGLRTDLGIADLPFILGGMVPEYLSTGTRTAIAAVHADTPYRLAYTAYAAGPTGHSLGDGNHYAATGQRILGRSMFDGYLDALTRTTALASAAPGQVVGVAASNVSDTSLTLTWTATSTATAYLVERKLTSGSTWTTVGTPTAATQSVTGLTASTSYDFRVTASNSVGSGSVSATLTQATTATPLLTNSVLPAITGTATDGQTLTASNGTWSATPDSYTYQWKRAGTNISGATASTYVLVTADVGNTITVTVTAVKSGYTSGSATSAATGTIAAGASVTDSFTRADSSSLGTTETGSLTWAVENGGTWAIASNAVSLTAPPDTGGGCQAVLPTGASDGTLSVKLGAHVTTLAGLRFRIPSAGSIAGYYFFHDIGAGNYALTKHDGTTFTSMATSSGVTPATNDVLSVVLSGTSIICKINGTTVITTTDSSHTGTRHGLFGLFGNVGGSVVFDDFSWSP